MYWVDPGKLMFGGGRVHWVHPVSPMEEGGVRGNAGTLRTAQTYLKRQRLPATNSPTNQPPQGEGECFLPSPGLRVSKVWCFIVAFA